MSNFKIATWNVNSLRVRLPHVLAWLEVEKPDVLAIQELKLEEPFFPYQPFADVGYQAVVSGQKTYNGVAVLSREKGKNIVTDIEGFSDPQRRILAVTIGNSMRVINLYVPNGESIASEKYQYKLNWLHNLNQFLKYEKQSYPQMLVLGDFNIAPAEIDVHDPKLWDGRVLCTDAERSAFQNLLDIGLKDCFRHLYPDKQAFSWWDYRLNAFKRNMGLRIDHILSSGLANCAKCYIDQTPRSWERPSDHAPVIAEFVL